MSGEPLFLAPRLVFDSAFLGWARRPGDDTLVAIYDRSSCIEAAIFWYDLSPQDAQTYVDMQCAGPWVGSSTP